MYSNLLLIKADVIKNVNLMSKLLRIDYTKMCLFNCTRTCNKETTHLDLNFPKQQIANQSKFIIPNINNKNYIQDSLVLRVH